MPASALAFERLRAYALRLPEGASELLPLIDFLETFPEQGTEEDLVHLVGTSAFGIARATQGGLFDGHRWLFLRGSAPPFPTNPGTGWVSLPWNHQDECFGHLVLKAGTAPPALELLLVISAPLLRWRRLEALRSTQNTALNLQLSRLSTVFDLTRSLGQVERPQELLGILVNTLAGEFRIPRILVLGLDGTVLVSRGLGRLAPLLQGEELQVLLEDKGLGHLLEIRDQSRSHGFIHFGDPMAGSLGEEDEQFLHTLVNLTAGHMANLELRESRSQAERLEKDLDLARNIQRQLLPKRLPEPPGWECAAANLPYLAVGGDLYDVWIASDPPVGGWEDEQEGERLHLAVADVSGKGLPAALMMTQLSAYLRARADRRVRNWGRLAMRLNVRMNEVRDRNRYATLFAASLHPGNGDLRYVNGGHNPPLLVRKDGTFLRLDPTGPMVGLLPDVTFEQGHSRMEPGDTLLAFTDGLVEAESVQGMELGDEALAEVVRAHDKATADQLLEALLVRAFAHMEGGGFKDDVTLLVVRRLAG